MARACSNAEGSTGSLISSDTSFGATFVKMRSPLTVMANGEYMGEFGISRKAKEWVQQLATTTATTTQTARRGGMKNEMREVSVFSTRVRHTTATHFLRAGKAHNRITQGLQRAAGTLVDATLQALACLMAAIVWMLAAPQPPLAGEAPRGQPPPGPARARGRGSGPPRQVLSAEHAC